MTILAHFACSPVSVPDSSSRELNESNSFRRVRRSSGSSSADMDYYTEKVEDESEQTIRRLKYERDLLKHQLGMANKKTEELSIQVQTMHYSSSCPTFNPYMGASPRHNPLSPGHPINSPFSYLHNLPIDEEGQQLMSGDGLLIPANYPGGNSQLPVVRSAASSPTTGFQRSHLPFMSTSMLDIPRARPPLHVNTVPRSRGTTPPVSPQQTSPNMSSGGVLDALDSIASSFSEAIRSDLQLLGLDMDEYDNPDKKRADELQSEVERLQRVLEVERQERKGLDCRIRELENLVEGLKHDKHDLMQQVSMLASKASPRSEELSSSSFDRSAVLDQVAKSHRPLSRMA